MGSFELVIKLEAAQVEELNNAGQRVTIVKACSNGGTEDYNLAWVNFRAMQTNKVSWETAFAVYASDVKVQNGATIESVAQMNANDHFKEYLFNEDNVFKENQKNDGKANFYYVKNGNTAEGSYTFGLAQSVQVNTKSFAFNPINAVKVFKNQNASFNPIEKIKIYMEANSANGKVITNVASEALLLDFTKDTKQTIKFDSDTSKFVLA